MTARYSSGEEPRVGDLVRCVRDRYDGRSHVGDVRKVAEVGPARFTAEGCDFTEDPERFVLVSRDLRRGDPVEPPFACRTPLSYTYAGVGPLREGDELEATFKGRFAVVAGEGCIELPGRDGPAGKLRPQYVNLERAEMVKAVEKPLAVGDRVRCTLPGDTGSGVILAIDGDHAWVKADSDGARITAYLNEMERAE